VRSSPAQPAGFSAQTAGERRGALAYAGYRVSGHQMKLRHVIENKGFSINLIRK